jgi:hypothetical protein
VSKRAEYKPVHSNNAVILLKDNMEEIKTPVETKGGKATYQLRLVHQPSLLEAARGMLKGSAGGATYKFRCVVGPSAMVIASNVTAGFSAFSPTATSEWSGIIDALFDEYRVDSVTIHYSPVMYSGSDSLFDFGAFVVGSDFDNTVSPTSWAQIQAYSDSKLYPAMLQSASGYFISNATLHSHHTKMPKQVAVAGSVATVEWLGVGDSWPGGQCLYATTTGTNGVATIYRWGEYFVECRMRR